MAEPDELVCLDKVTGKKLWTQAINDYAALTPEEKAAQPKLAAEVDPLIAKLKATGSLEEDKIARTKLREEIQDKLVEIDSATFTPKYDGHFEAHFGIVGFTMPTPVSDGEKVYVWIGTGIAACFDLDGNRQWMTRIYPGDVTYGSSSFSTTRGPPPLSSPAPSTSFAPATRSAPNSTATCHCRPRRRSAIRRRLWTETGCISAGRRFCIVLERSRSSLAGPGPQSHPAWAATAGPLGE
ncbi:MAG: hypothetical protein IAF94_24195 [Pirellulaceae bacterium]|nr:hypothetical protein [Pirellulaceae bacterium]